MHDRLCPGCVRAGLASARVLTVSLPGAGAVGPHNWAEKAALIGIYAPYLILPLWLTVGMAATDKPFGTPTIASKGSKKSN